MVRVVLSCDYTLMSDYWCVPLLNFLPCSPVENFPKSLFKFLSPSIPHYDGVAKFAPYGLRKLEAGLLRGYKSKEVVVAHPNYIEKFIDEDTKIIGLSEMDPLGLGPVTMMFTNGGILTSYTKMYFTDLVNRINKVREKRAPKAKLVVGGSGAWQLEIRENERKKLKIDHLVIGELDVKAYEIFQSIEEDGAPEIIKLRSIRDLNLIPSIVNPSIQGMVEVMRGCGRNCEFCEPNLRLAKYFPLNKISEEIDVNLKAGMSNVWIHSEDIFLYQLEDKKNFIPNRDALIDLFSMVMKKEGVTNCNPTHGTVCSAVADPLMIKKISEILKASPDHWIGLQPGLETGSASLIKKYMPLKVKPFSPEEWQDVVFEGTRILNENYWFPAYTLILGLPGESPDDCWETVRLIDRMEKQLPEKVGPKAHFTATPLSFVPLGVLKGERFFKLEEMIDESRFAVIYRCWRHIMKEARNASLKVLKARNPLIWVSVWLFMKFGNELVIKAIEKWGEKMGFKVEKTLQITYN